MDKTDRKIFRDMLYYKPKFDKDEKPALNDKNTFIGLGWT